MTSACRTHIESSGSGRETPTWCRHSTASEGNPFYVTPQQYSLILPRLFVSILCKKFCRPGLFETVHTSMKLWDIIAAEFITPQTALLTGSLYSFWLYILSQWAPMDSFMLCLEHNEGKMRVKRRQQKSLCVMSLFIKVDCLLVHIFFFLMQRLWEWTYWCAPVCWFCFLLRELMAMSNWFSLLCLGMHWVLCSGPLIDETNTQLMQFTPQILCFSRANPQGQDTSA